MKIIADAAIPYVRHYFARLGELELLDGRAIDHAAVRDADILIVRTVTRVDADLLRDSRVGFVASATSGIDHIDTTFLADKGIGFAAAAGCNARAVAEYVLSSLFVLAEQQDRDPREQRVGIIGCGHVGSTLHRFLDACGLSCMVCDPPLQERGTDTDYEFVPLDEVRAADIISLHVPLIREGDYPTAGMLDGGFLDGVREKAVIINTSRGEVVDEEALIRFLDAKPGAAAVVDVWRDEPRINTELLRRVRIGTAHIAGYSTDAKLRGTRMVYERVCEFLQRQNEMNDPVLPGNDYYHLTLSGQDDIAAAVGMAILSSYDVRSDGASLAGILQLDDSDRADYFSGLRHDYPLRREFPAMHVDLKSCPGEIANILLRLGFQVDTRG